MKIAIIGATGFVGASILNEAASRGHSIVAITKSVDKLPKSDLIKSSSVDIYNESAIYDSISGCDVVIHAFAPPRSESIEDRISNQKRGTQNIINAVKRSRIERLIAVGGAGTAEVAPGVKLMDSYFFSPNFEGGARSTAVIKKLLENESSVEWVFISPPNLLENGPRTGKYRTGVDNLIIEIDTGRSYMSVADFAVAVLDEIEYPKHHNMRFTVGM